MASRKVTRSAADKAPRDGTSSQSHRVAKLVGGALIIFACLCLGWLLLFRFGIGVGVVAGPASLPSPGSTPTGHPTTLPSSLTDAGISLGHPMQAPALTEQQALVIASQLEPNAAAHAGKTHAQYVLLNYAGTNASASHADLSNVPAWMIVYQQIPLAPGDLSADPTPFPQTHHDLYIFLDANSGKEILAIWV